MRLGLTNGCFDGLHEGHRFFLRECLLNCDKLIVLMNDDWWLRSHKGQPLFRLGDRIRSVRSMLRAWDEVHSWDGNDLAYEIGLFLPDVVFRGWDQAHDVKGVPVMRFTRHGEYSSTALRA